MSIKQTDDDDDKIKTLLPNEAWDAIKRAKDASKNRTTKRIC